MSSKIDISDLIGSDFLIGDQTKIKNCEMPGSKIQLDYRRFKDANIDPTMSERHKVLFEYVIANGVWFHPSIVGHLTHLAPFAIRDPSCRKSFNHETEEWGKSSEEALVRDDNSLPKNWVKLVPVLKGDETLYLRGIKNGYTACHLWRGKINNKAFNLDPRLYTCVANLCWLPTDFSYLSDTMDSFVQTLIQAISLMLYGDLCNQNKHISEFFSTMDLDKTKENMVKFNIKNIDQVKLNFFLPSKSKVQRHYLKITQVIEVLESTNAAIKFSPSRYAPSVIHVDPIKKNLLKEYLKTHLPKAA